MLQGMAPPRPIGVRVRGAGWSWRLPAEDEELETRGENILPWDQFSSSRQGRERDLGEDAEEVGALVPHDLPR